MYRLGEKLGYRISRTEELQPDCKRRSPGRRISEAGGWIDCQTRPILKQYVRIGAVCYSSQDASAKNFLLWESTTNSSNDQGRL
jgi:hypothetical protein